MRIRVFFSAFELYHINVTAAPFFLLSAGVNRRRIVWVPVYGVSTTDPVWMIKWLRVAGFSAIILGWIRRLYTQILMSSIKVSWSYVSRLDAPRLSGVKHTFSCLLDSVCLSVNHTICQPLLCLFVDSQWQLFLLPPMRGPPPHNNTHI